jgi:hypothetical protein
MQQFSNKYYKFEYSDKLPEINIINPLLENYRYKLFRKLEQEFINFFMNKKINKNIKPDSQRIKVHKAFGRWIMLQVSLGNNKIDPLIPSEISEMSYSPQLIEDIHNFTRDKTIGAEKLIKELDLISKCKKYINEIKEYIKQHKIKSFDKTIAINNFYNKASSMYELSVGEGTRTVEVSKLIHDRIKILFITNQSFSENLQKTEEDFYYVLYCLMLRYITISEEGVRQAGLMQIFFDALYKTFNINFECCASSFGASTNYICSLFYDIEQYFGSYGNFFELKPIKGFYQCSPPLDSLITTMAMEHIIDILTNDKNKHPLGFICFIPAWDHETLKKKGITGKLDMYEEFPIYYKLRDSKFLIYNHNIINKKIMYYQYQGKGEILGTFEAPHIIILGNETFRKTFNKDKLNALLEIFLK